jgi:hypothetical protein
MAVPKSTLADVLNDHFATSSTLYALLLDNALQTNLSVTANPATNTFTSVVPHKLVTGSRVRVAAAAGGGNFVPTGLSSSVDVFVIRDTATAFRVAATLADAQSGTEIDFTDAGQGVVINEQQLIADDPLAVLINHELPSTSPGYATRPASTVGVSSLTPTLARKDCSAISLSPSGGSLAYRHLLILSGASSTVGQISGQVEKLFTEPALVTINNGESKVIVLELQARSL